VLVHNCPKFTPQDLQAVSDHLQQFGSWGPNDAMISGIQEAMDAGSPLSEGQINFMTHELTEKGLMDDGMDYEAAHAQALETHPLFMNYTPEVIDQFPEAFNNNWRAAWGLGPR
jgi:hypothetical protein